MKYDLKFIMRQSPNNPRQSKTVSNTRSIRRTFDGDPLTLFDFPGRVGGHAVVRSFLRHSHLCNLVGRLQFVRVLGIEGALFSRVVPGKGDGHSASLNRAHQGYVLPLGDVPHVGQDSQHRHGHRFCKQSSCWTKMIFIFFPSAFAANIPINVR